MSDDHNDSLNESHNSVDSMDDSDTDGEHPLQMVTDSEDGESYDEDHRRSSKRSSDDASTCTLNSFILHKALYVIVVKCKYVQNETTVYSSISIIKASQLHHLLE